MLTQDSWECATAIGSILSQATTPTRPRGGFFVGWILLPITTPNMPYAAKLLPPALPRGRSGKKKGLADEANPFFLLELADGFEPTTC